MEDDRRLLPKRLRQVAPPEILHAARADYDRYRAICGRFSGCEPESWRTFYGDWLETRYFEALNAAAAAPESERRA